MNKISQKKYNLFNLPREDNSLSFCDVLNEKDNSIKLKKYIILLRRNGSGEVFKHFKNFVIKNFKDILLEFNLRNLVSLLDTFIDWGSDSEKLKAYTIVSFVYHERFHLTNLSIYNSRRKGKLNLMHQTNALSTHSIRLAYDDAPILFLYRIGEIVKGDDLFRLIWVRVFNMLVKDKRFMISTLLENMGSEMKDDYDILLKDIFKKGYIEEFNLKHLDYIKTRSYNYTR